MATGSQAPGQPLTRTRLAVAPPHQRATRLLVLASVAMRPEVLSARCLDCLLSEFRALKAVLH